jgi:hypothetical protein
MTISVAVSKRRCEQCETELGDAQSLINIINTDD